MKNINCVILIIFIYCCLSSTSVASCIGEWLFPSAFYFSLHCHGILSSGINKMLHTIACTFCMQNVLLIKSSVMTTIRPHFLFCKHRCDCAGQPLLHCDGRRSDTGAKPMLLSCASNLYLWANQWPWWGPKDSCAYKCIVCLLTSILSVAMMSLCSNCTKCRIGLSHAYRRFYWFLQCLRYKSFDNIQQATIICKYCSSCSSCC